MTILGYQVSVVKNPMGEGYIGMLVGQHFDGTPLTICTLDEFGEMQEFETPAEAEKTAKLMVFALASLRTKPASEITPKELGKNLRILSSDDELLDEL